MRDALRTLVAAAACALVLVGCGGPSTETKAVDITGAWKDYFTDEEHPKSWRTLGEATQRVRLDDGFLSIDGAIGDCEDARVYWQMGIAWKKRNPEVSRFVTVYSEGELAGDTTTTGEFDCHL